MSSRRGVDRSTRRSILAVFLAALVVVSMPATAAVAIGTSTQVSGVQPSNLEASSGDQPAPSGASSEDRSGSSVPESLGDQDNETETADGTFSLRLKEYQPFVTSDSVYEVAVLVRNTGPVADRTNVTLRAIDEVQDSTWVTLEPGERREVTLTWRPTNAAGQFQWTVRAGDDSLNGQVLIENREVGIEYGDVGVQSGSAAVLPNTRELPTKDNWGREPIRQWESQERPFMIKVDTSQFDDNPDQTVESVEINGEPAQTIVDQRDYRKKIDSYDSSPATVQVEVSDQNVGSIIVRGQHTWTPKDAAWYNPFDSLVGSNLDERQEWVELDGAWDEGQTNKLKTFAKGSFTTVDEEVLPHPQCTALIDVSQSINGKLEIQIGQQPTVSGSLGGSGELGANCVYVTIKGQGTLQFAGGGELDEASVGITIKVEKKRELGYDSTIGEVTLVFSYGIEVSGKATFQELWEPPEDATVSLKGTAGVKAKLGTDDYGAAASGGGKVGPKFKFGGEEAVVSYEGVEGSVSFKIYLYSPWVSWTIIEYQESGTLAHPLSGGFQDVERKHLMPAGGFDRLAVEPGTPFASHTRVTNRTFDDVVPAVTAAPAVTDDLAVITATQPAGESVYTRNLVQQEFDETTGEWTTGPQITNDSSRIPAGTAVDAGNETALLVASFSSLPGNLSNWSYDDYRADPLSSVGFLSHDGGSWGAVRRLTNSSSFHRAPDVAVTPTGDEAAIAYEVYQEPPSRNRLNLDREAEEITYHLVTNGTVTANRSLANTTSPALDTANGSLLLSYYDNETDEIVVGQLDENGTFTRTDQYGVGDRYLDHAMDGDELVVGTRDEQEVGNVTIRHVDANGTVEELPTVPLISAGSFEFESGENRSVLSYTGLIENGTRGTDAIRQVKSNGTWSEPLLLSGGVSTNASAYHPTQTIADGDPTVAYVAREHGSGPPPLQENRTAGDVFLTRVNSTSVLAIDDLQAPNASSGDNATVTATVRNAGSESGSGDLVILGDDGARLASTTVTLAPRTSTTESFDNLEVPDSGTFSATIQPNDTQATALQASIGASGVPWISQNASVQIAQPNLSVSGIETQASSPTDGTVTVTIQNNGSAFATDRVVRLEDNSGLVSDKTVPDVPPDGNATLSWDVEPASLDLSGQAAVTIDPESSLIPDAYSLLFEPNLSIVPLPDGSVSYHNTSNGTTVLVNLNNSGVGTAYDVRTTMYRPAGNMSELGSRSIPRVPGRSDRYVPIQLSNVTTGQFHELFVDPWGQTSRSTGFFLITVLQDNFTVDVVERDDSGDQLRVTANVTNTGSDDSDQAIDLVVNGELRNQTLLSRMPGESGNVTLTANTSDVETLSSVTVSSLDDSDELRSSVAVRNLTLEETNVSRGEGFNVSVELANVGELAGQREISLRVDGTTAATRTVEVGPGNATVVTFRNVTIDLPPRNYEVRVETGDDSAVATVTVGNSQGYACSIANENDEVTTIVLFEAINDWRYDEIDLSWLFDVIDDWQAGGPLNC